MSAWVELDYGETVVRADQIEGLVLKADQLAWRDKRRGLGPYWRIHLMTQSGQAGWAGSLGRDEAVARAFFLRARAAIEEGAA